MRIVEKEVLLSEDSSLVDQGEQLKHKVLVESHLREGEISSACQKIGNEMIRLGTQLNDIIHPEMMNSLGAFKKKEDMPTLGTAVKVVEKLLSYIIPLASIGNTANYKQGPLGPFNAMMYQMTALQVQEAAITATQETLKKEIEKDFIPVNDAVIQPFIKLSERIPQTTEKNNIAIILGLPFEGEKAPEDHLILAGTKTFKQVEGVSNGYKINADLMLKVYNEVQ